LTHTVEGHVVFRWLTFYHSVVCISVCSQANYNHAVFECYTAKGCVEPGRTAAVEWKFSPLEAKTYLV